MIFVLCAYIFAFDFEKKNTVEKKGFICSKLVVFEVLKSFFG